MKSIILWLLLVSLVQSVNAQFYGHPPFYFKTPIGYKKSNAIHSGVVFVDNGNKIEGLIKFRRNGNVTVKSENDSGFKVVQNSVQIRLFQTDTSLLSQKYTDYYYLKVGKRYAWYRQLVDGKISLYDQTTYCNEVPNYINFSKIVVKRDSTYENIINFWSTSYKSDLVKGLNISFGTTYKNKDFKNKIDVIKKYRLLASN